MTAHFNCHSSQVAWVASPHGLSCLGDAVYLEGAGEARRERTIVKRARYCGTAGVLPSQAATKGGGSRFRPRAAARTTSGGGEKSRAQAAKKAVGILTK